MIVSNNGYIMFGAQAAKGTPVVPTITVPYISESFNVGMDIQYLSEGADNDYSKSDAKLSHQEAWGFSVFARPSIATYLFGYLLGTDSFAPGIPWCDHTFSRSDRRYLTLERRIDSGACQRIYDTKIEKISISGQSGRPIQITVSGIGINSDLITSVRTPSYPIDSASGENTAMFYNGSGVMQIDGVADNNINSFNINISVDSMNGMVDDQYQTEDVPDFTYKVDGTIGVVSTNSTRWKNVNYNTTTIPSENLYTGSLYIRNVTSLQEISMRVRSATFAPVGGVQLSGNPSTIVETIAFVGKKLPTTELVNLFTKSLVNAAV